MTSKFEKSALQSKKFIAFLVVEVGLFLLMAFMIWKGGDKINLLTLIITAGFLASFFIGGQALVDKYTRVAEIAASKLNSLKLSSQEEDLSENPSGLKEDALEEPKNEEE